MDSRCWDTLLPHLDGTCHRGRPARPGPSPGAARAVTFADCAQAVADDVDAAGFDEIVLVGHSLAGCSMPAMVGLLGDRVRDAVFVACTVPEDGTTCIATLDPAFRERGGPTVDGRRAAGDERGDREDRARRRPRRRAVRLVRRAARARGPGLTRTVDLSPFRERPAVRRTWVRTTHDIIVRQNRAASPATSATARWSTSSSVTCASSDGRRRPRRSSTRSPADRAGVRSSGVLRHQRSSSQPFRRHLRLVAERVLLDLPRRGERQVVDHDPPTGHLVPSEALAGELLERRPGRRPHRVRG